MLKSSKYDLSVKAISWISIFLFIYSGPACSQYQYEIQHWEQAGSSELPTGLIENNEKGYLIAGTKLAQNSSEGTIYCINTDSTGNLLWTLNLGGKGESFNGIACENNDPNYSYVYGTTISPEFANFDSSAPFGGTYVPALYLAKITWDGTRVWEKSYREGTIFFNNTQIISGGENLFMLFDKYYTENQAGIMKIDTNGSVVRQKIFSKTDFPEITGAAGIVLHSTDIIHYGGHLLALLDCSDQEANNVNSIMVVLDLNLVIKSYQVVPGKRAVKNGSFVGQNESAWIKFHDTWYKIDSSAFAFTDSLTGFTEPQLVQAGLGKYYTFVTANDDHINVSVTNTSFGITHNFNIYRDNKMVRPADVILSSGNKVAIVMDESPGENINEYDISLVLIDLAQFDNPPQTYTWNLFPNPVDQVLHVRAYQMIDEIEVRLFNNHGQEIHRNVLHDAGEFDLEMDGYNSGLYYLQINSEVLKKTFKIVKQ